MYEFEFEFDLFGNGEWKCIKRIAYLKCLKFFNLNLNSVAFASKQLTFNIFKQNGFIKAFRIKVEINSNKMNVFVYFFRQ